MIEGNLEMRIHWSPWRDSYEIAFFSKSHERVFVAGPLTMTELPRNSPLGSPTAELDHNALQGFFNELWRLGFRPKDGSGGSGHLAAVQYHLEDMRKLVFGDNASMGSNTKENDNG